MIDKRLPFGFKGEWGRLYKLYNNNLVVDNTIKYLDSVYYDIGEDIQVKELDNSSIIDNAQPISNLIAKGEFKVVETTDEVFNSELKKYECVISPNDILNVFNCYWVVEKIEAKSIYTPNKQTFYYVSIKKIFANILTETPDETNLPLEKVVETQRYDETTGKIVLTLHNGRTIEIDVGDDANVK